jgi:acetyl-CoA C-acetyltransferase
MTDIVIAGGARTPVGTFNGKLSSVAPTELGVVAVQEALKRAKTDAAEVQEVIMGLVLSGNTGAGPARQVCINAGIPHDTSTAYAINQLCASGMRAIGEGFNSIKLGDTEVVVAGGMESMSWSPHVGNMRGGTKMGPVKFEDSMLRDGLIDPFGLTTWVTPPKTSPRSGRSPARSRISSPWPRRTRPRRRRSPAGSRMKSLP